MIPSSVQRIAAIVYPGEREANAIRWFLHGLLWSALLVGLWQLNRAGSVDRVLRSPWPTLHGAWLPFLGLFVYLLGWLSRGLWLALARTAPEAEPDLASAWNHVSSALDHAHISLDKTPLFIILGHTGDETRGMLETLGSVPMAQPTNAPFRVFAGPNAVFVLCGRSGQLDPLCDVLDKPIRGITLVVPWQETQSAAGMRQVITRLKDDLRAIRHSTGLEAPLYFLVSGAPIHAAVFQRFPPLPDLDSATVPEMLEAGVDRLCLELLPGQVREHFRVEGPLEQNVRRYKQIAAFHAWRTRLLELLVDGTQNEHAHPGMVAGCYLLPPGDTKAIAKEWWADLVAHQQVVPPTVETLAAGARQRRQIWLGYVGGAAVVCVGLAALGGLLMTRF